jgi:hypothetical protein
VKLSYLHTGGIMGTRRSCELNVEELPAAERARILKMLDESGLRSKSFPQKLSKANDAFQYEIEFQDAGATHTARFDDVTMPARVRPLVEYLREKAGPLR